MIVLSFEPTGGFFRVGTGAYAGTVCGTGCRSEPVGIVRTGKSRKAFFQRSNSFMAVPRRRHPSSICSGDAKV